MEAGSVSLIAGTGDILKTDIWGTINERMHEHSPELGEALVKLVQEKTPQLSGSLFSDMTYEAYTNPDEGIDVGESDLVWVYAEGIAQEAYWNRIYVQYVEGGPLGEPTYTNPPREMFFLTATTDGLAEVQVWGEFVVAEANLLSVSGAGVPWAQPGP
jgi:hypothetical protein